LLVVAAVLAIVTVVSAWIASGRADRGRRGRGAPAALAGSFARVGLRPPATTGIRLALDRGRGRSAVPVRSALAGATFGIVGVVAVGVFAASVSTLVDTPRHYGSPWNAIAAGFKGDLVTKYRDELAADPKVAALGTVAKNTAQLPDHGDMNVYAFASLKGSANPTLLEGRLPAS